MDEEVNQDREAWALRKIHRSEMEEDFVMSEHPEEFGVEQGPARIRAPPRKRRD